MAKDKKKRKAIEPVLEQARRYTYALEAITDKGQVIGHAYRRKPLFETMFVRGELSRDEVAALRYYRERYELMFRSPTRSCLAPSYGRSNGPITPATVRSSRELSQMEAAAGLFIDTFKSVVLQDTSFNQLAIERYGSAEKELPNGRKRIVPKSNAHTRRIKSEFQAVMDCFMPVTQSLICTNFPVDFAVHARHKSATSMTAPAASAS